MDKKEQNKRKFSFFNKKAKNTAKDSGKKPFKEKLSALFAKRSFRYGSTATLFTVIFIVAVILINVVVSSLSDRFTLSLDMTNTQQNQLTTKSINFAKKISKTVDIDILAEESTYANGGSYASALQMIKQYTKENTKIKLNFINLDKDPTFASKYSSETLETGDIMVVCGSKYKHISSSDLFTSSTDSTTGESTYTENNTEQQIDTALSYVTTNDQPTVLVTAGHNETSATSLTDLLEKNNYKIESKTIATDGMDSNARMVLICAPTTDFTADDIQKLDDFLYNGGKYGKTVFMAFNPQQTTLPNLESFAAKWGIKVGSGVVYDETNRYQDSYFDVLEGDTDSDYVGSLNSNLHAYLSVCRPLSLLFTSQNNITTTSLVATSSTSKVWNPGNLSSQTSFNPSSSDKTDKSGPFDVFDLASESETVNSKPVKSNVLVLGSTNFFDSTVLSESSLTNSNILLNTLNTVVGYTPAITVDGKDLTTSTVTITAAQSQAIVVIFVFLVPIVVLAAGLAMWLRRRHQ